MDLVLEISVMGAIFRSLWIVLLEANQGVGSMVLMTWNGISECELWLRPLQTPTLLWRMLMSALYHILCSQFVFHGQFAVFIQ